MLKKIGVAGLSILFSVNAFATKEIYLEEIPVIWSPIVTLSGGGAWARPGQNQYLYPQPAPNYNYYIYNFETQAVANGEVFFGLQRFAYDPWLIMQLGLGVAGASNVDLSGTVTINGTPDIYNFYYKLNHGRIELKGKLIACNFNYVQPYVSGSLGAGFNNSHDYRAISINQALFPAPWFDTVTILGFAYTLGAGVQYTLNPNWQIGVGYEFTDWGKSYLNGDDNITLSKGPKITHMYTNGFLVTLGYLFT